ncbi:MAG: DUF1592 domain-containing protein [Myxococcota bacterium]
MRRTQGWLIAGLLIPGCGALQADAERTGTDTSDEASGEDGAEESDGGSDDADVPTDAQCVWEEGVPSVPMRRLTRLEYDNTVRDLFGVMSQPALAFVDDSPAGGFDANDIAVSELQTRLYIDVAEAVAAEIVAGPVLLSDCDLGEVPCVDGFVATWGRRVFRRDLTEVELVEYRDFFTQMRDEHGIDAALEHTLTAWLASPHFLYLAHRESANEPLADAYAQASRLSFFLWSSAPDDALLDQAAAGQLDELDALEGIVRDMLDDPRAADTLATFTEQWLHVEALTTGVVAKDAELYPSFDPALAASMDRELQALFADVVLEREGTVRELLQTRRAWVDAPLAALYGVDTPAGEEGWAELPEGERAGILTRAGFLTVHAHEREGSVVKRGVIVRRDLLCEELPPPPPELDLDPAVGRLDNPQCAGCHVLMDPIGEGLREYDAIGRWTGAPSSGEIGGLPEPSFDGGVGLSEVLADAESVQRCVTRQLFKFSHRRAITEADACTLELAEQAVIDSGGDIREAIVAVATSDSFRFGLDEGDAP